MRKVANILLIISALILIGLMGLVSYKFYEKSQEVNKIQGSWIRSIDIQNEIVEIAYDYLSWADGNTIDKAYVKDKVGVVSLDINLTFTSTGKNIGVFTQEMTKESYDIAYQKAYKALEESMRQIIVLRLEAAGFDVSDETKVDALIAEALGESLDFYMIKMGPKLIEEFEKLNGDYSDTGTYQIVDGLLIMDGVLPHNKANVARVKDRLYFEEIQEGENEAAVYIYQKVNSDGPYGAIVNLDDN